MNSKIRWSWNTLTYPIAEKFKDETFIKPTLKKTEFYKGGVLAMQKRFQRSLIPFHGAFAEFVSRTEGLDNSSTVAIMWEYIRLE